MSTHYEIGIVRRFDFSSKLQRMSVIVKNNCEDFFKIFAKGSPEKIKEMCREETIPNNFTEILSKYTKVSSNNLKFKERTKSIRSIS